MFEESTALMDPHGTADKPATPKKERRRVAIHRRAWTIVGLTYFAVACACLWPADLRNTSTLFSSAAWLAFMIRTFLFHFGLLVTLVVVGEMALRRWSLAVAMIPLWVFCLVPEMRTDPVPTAAVGHRATTLMSINLLGSNDDAENILKQVSDITPDVLFLQEYDNTWHAVFSERIATEYPYHTLAPRPGSFGAAIYSRVPFVDVPRSIALGVTGLPQLRTAIVLEGQPVALYNLHLCPPKTIWHFNEARRQLADLLDALDDEKMPVILAGDFNFTDRSANAAELHRLGFRDAHRLASDSRGGTWPATTFLQHLPGLRIDHFYLGDNLTATWSKSGEPFGSDHRPISATIGLTSYPLPALVDSAQN